MKSKTAAEPPAPVEPYYSRLTTVLATLVVAYTAG